MATAFDWIKLALERWAVVLPILLFLVSATGLSFSLADNIDKDEQITASQEQVTAIIDYYEKDEKVAIKSTCQPCDLNKHIKRDH